MVYVDDAFIPYGRMKMSHMIADSEIELHAMAVKIGVDRKHFQCANYPHYDICKSKRAIAVKLGAVEITTRQLVDKCKVNAVKLLDD